MADWWTELESEILNCLERPEIAEAATASLLSVPLRDGKVWIRLVEVARGASEELEPDAAPLRRGLA